MEKLMKNKVSLDVWVHDVHFAIKKNGQFVSWEEGWKDGEFIITHDYKDFTGVTDIYYSGYMQIETPEEMTRLIQVFKEKVQVRSFCSWIGDVDEEGEFIDFS